jgi:hypothetical protein
MAQKKPIVLEGAELQQLQAGDDLDVPSLDDRMVAIEKRQRALELHLLNLGMELPEALVEPNPLARCLDEEI